MYQGKPYDNFNKVSDFQSRWYVDPSEKHPRKKGEYRSALRNEARISYRIAKRTIKDMRANENSAD